MMDPGNRDSLLTAVERTTGYVVIGKLATHTAAAFADRAIHLLRTSPIRSAPSPPTMAPK